MRTVKASCKAHLTFTVDLDAEPGHQVIKMEIDARLDAFDSPSLAVLFDIDARDEEERIETLDVLGNGETWPCLMELPDSIVWSN